MPLRATFYLMTTFLYVYFLFFVLLSVFTNDQVGKYSIRMACFRCRRTLVFTRAQAYVQTHTLTTHAYTICVCVCVFNKLLYILPTFYVLCQPQTFHHSSAQRKLLVVTLHVFQHYLHICLFYNKEMQTQLNKSFWPDKQHNINVVCV